MIKNVWKKIVNWLFSWQKKEKDEHLELYEDVPEPEIKVEKTESEKIKCNTHSRFKKSCPICVEVANG